MIGKPRAFIESVAFAITFLVFALILLRTTPDEPLTLLLVPVPVPVLVQLYRSIAGISLFLFAFFTFSLVRPKYLTRFEELFEGIPSNRFWRYCSRAFLVIFWFAIWINFSDALVSIISKSPIQFRLFITVGGIIWLLFIIVIIVGKFLAPNYKMATWIRLVRKQTSHRGRICNKIRSALYSGGRIQRLKLRIKKVTKRGT